MAGFAASAVPPPDKVSDAGTRPPLVEVDAALSAKQLGLLESWLDWQCKMIAGVLRGVVFRIDKNQLSPDCAVYPSSSREELQSNNSFLLGLAQQTLESSQPQILQNLEISDLVETHADSVCLPINSNGKGFIVCLLLVPRSKSQLAAVQQLLQWGGVWLTSLEQRNAGSGQTVHGDDLVHGMLQSKDLYTACVFLVNRFCSDLGCERVSVGLLERLNVRLIAVSQLAVVDRKQQLIRTLEATMSESTDQEKPLLWPSADSAPVNRLSAHQQLARENGQLAICTIPIVTETGVVGAVLLERESGRSFSTDEIKAYSDTLSGCAPVLALMADAERGFLSRSVRRLSSGSKSVLAPESKRKRWKIAVASACLLAIAFFPVTHRVSARASIEGADKQVLVAPQGGYVNSAHFRAGDVVEAGDVLATLDDRDLLIDKNKWQGELNKLKTSFSQALTTRDRSQIGLLQAKKQQVAAELELVDQKLERTKVVAPFSGVLVSGDLNQSLGAPVEIGQTLFEIAALEDFRLLLSVSEQDVARIKPGQTSQVRLSSMPGQSFAATVEELIPVSVQHDGRNVFRLQAAIEPGSGELRPGMQGIAKISTERDPLIWIVLHPLFDKVRLMLWSLWF